MSLYAGAPRRRLGRRLAGALAVIAGFGAATSARADGVIAGPDLVPVEQRLAIAVSGDRSTVWSSLRFDGPGGTVALVVPVKDGSALDYTSRAFFEALEDATAVRVVPPDQKPAVCDGAGTDATFSVEGDTRALAPIAPDALIVLPSSVDVQAWAQQQGLLVDPALVSAMDAIDAGYGFAVLRFIAPPGPQVTRTFRAVAPSATPVLPFVLSVASTADLRITAWSLGPQRARLSGVEVALDPDELAFHTSTDPEKYASNYRGLLDAILSDPSRYAVEASSHFALASSVSLFDGTASIPALIDAYFTRAADAGDATEEPAGCTFKAATALGQAATFGHACPRAELGHAGSPTPCTPTSGPIDVGALACGGITDDLAVALSDLTASDAWVTRTVVRLAPHQSGLDATVTFGPAGPVDPVREASLVDETGCSPGSSTGSGPPPTTSGSGGSGFTEVPVYRQEGCDCSGNYVLIGWQDVADTGSDTPDALYEDGGDACSSDDSGLYTDDGDDCSYDPGDDTSSDGCDCSSDADPGGCDDGGDYGDDCGADASDSCDGAGDACDSGASADACDGFDASGCECTVKGGDARRDRLHGKRRSRGLPIRMSPVFYGLVLVAVPLRRKRRATPPPPKLRTIFRRVTSRPARAVPR